MAKNKPPINSLQNKSLPPESDGGSPSPKPAVGAVVFHEEKVLLVKRTNPPQKTCGLFRGDPSASEKPFSRRRSGKSTRRRD